MNPHSCNVEIYHQKISTTLDPRDILIPTSSPSKQRKIGSVFKFFGRFAAPRSLVAVGGILAVGCTIRVLWNRRKRPHGTLLRNDEPRELSRVDAGTQTESSSYITGQNVEAPKKVGKAVPSADSDQKNPMPREIKGNKCVPPHTHEILDSQQSSNNKLLTEVERSLSTVTEVSDDCERPKCHHSSKNEATAAAAKVDQPHHSCCYLSAFIALLALNKAIMCESAADTFPRAECEKGTTESLLFSSGTRPTTSVVRKQDNSAFKKARGREGSKIQQVRGPKETRHAARRDSFIPKNATKHETKKPQGPTPVLGSTPIDLQVQDNPFCTSKQRKNETTPPQDVSLSQTRSSNHGHGLKNNVSISFTRSSNHETETPFGENRRVDKTGVSRATEKPNGRKNWSSKLRSRGHNSDDFSPRGKPRGWKTGKKNLSRRPYVDLDNPKPIASQHQRQ